MKILKSKLLVMQIFLALFGLMVISSGAMASVKWSQLPDTTVNGIDIRCDRNDGIPRTLADDFKCTTTGPISGVHFWGSWKGDIKTQVTRIHLSIHEDIPATPTSPSRPGALKWSGDFFPGQFTEKLVYNLGNYFEWWWDPYPQGTLTSQGDHKIWLYDISINGNQFVQEGTATNPKIYWLDVYVTTASDASSGPTQFGWKTSRRNWQDKAGYVTTAGSWQDMTYPATHPYAGKPIDMAFEITTMTTATPHPYVAIDGFAAWDAAVLDGTVSPVDEANGFGYMQKWHSSNTPHEGSLYPPTEYREPELYAYSGNPCSGSDSDPCSPGLVMAWEPPVGPGPLSSLSAAWKYKYPVDPDLTTSIITVSVFPPCKSITAISLGLKDINGKIRAWFWDVNIPGGIPLPTGLPCGVSTAVSIDASIPGLAAATPTAAGYMSDPGFDIMQVVEIWFDENASWLGGIPVPPPGSTVPRAWNYWHDLTVTPKPTTTNNPLKWSQPAFEVDPGRILGWDEKSVDNSQPLLADDWLCKDQRPVTDIHWWGSFLGWMNPDFPTQLPIAFHLGIWTDVQPTAASNIPFSHPGEMIWEYTCTNYQRKFVGYDKDPRQANGTAPVVQDSCFRFDCDLPNASWFYQKPDPNGHGTIYWLSIAAIYPTGTNLEYPWGWKTRPHFFQDDAVRILTTVTGNWPPVLHSKWNSGQHLEYPRGVSWDLAFELTTSTTTVPPIVDYNADGIVNFIDLAVFASHWLQTQ